MRDAARIVHEVLTEHANGPDPALAVAARAELDYRRQRDRDALQAAGRAMIEGFARTLAPLTELAQKFIEAVGGPEAVRETIRRREQGECVAHEDPGVPAVVEYDGDSVCEDCAVDYLREDLEEEFATDG